jgi:hypothetical protein
VVAFQYGLIAYAGYGQYEELLDKVIITKLFSNEKYEKELDFPDMSGVPIQEAEFTNENAINFKYCYNDDFEWKDMVINFTISK